MQDIDFNEDQRMIRDMARQFAQRELALREDRLEHKLAFAAPILVPLPWTTALTEDGNHGFSY